MPAICKEFSENTWKKELCSNCFKTRIEHETNIISNEELEDIGGRYEQQATTKYSKIYSSTNLSNNIQSPATEKNGEVINIVNGNCSINHDDKIEIEKQDTSNSSSKIGNGKLDCSIVPNKVLVENGFKMPAIQISAAGILRNSEKHAKSGKVKNDKKTVSFFDEMLAVVVPDKAVYDYSSDDDDDVDNDQDDIDSDSDDDDSCWGGDDIEICRLTKSNTSFNSDLFNLLGVTRNKNTESDNKNTALTAAKTLKETEETLAKTKALLTENMKVTSFPKEPIQTEVPSAQTEVPPSQTEVPSTQTEVSSAQTEVSPAQTEVSPAQTEVSTAQTDVSPALTELSPAQIEVSVTVNNVLKNGDTLSCANKDIDNGKEKTVSVTTPDQDDEPPALPKTPPPSSNSDSGTFLTECDRHYTPRSSFLHGIVHSNGIGNSDESSFEENDNRVKTDANIATPSEQVSNEDTPSNIGTKPSIVRRPPILKEKPKLPYKPSRLIGSSNRTTMITVQKNENVPTNVIMSDSLTDYKTVDIPAEENNSLKTQNLPTQEVLKSEAKIVLKQQSSSKNGAIQKQISREECTVEQILSTEVKIVVHDECSKSDNIDFTDSQISIKNKNDFQPILKCDRELINGMIDESAWSPPPDLISALGQIISQRSSKILESTSCNLIEDTKVVSSDQEKTLNDKNISNDITDNKMSSSIQLDILRQKSNKRQAPKPPAFEESKSPPRTPDEELPKHHIFPLTPLKSSDISGTYQSYSPFNVSCRSTRIPVQQVELISVIPDDKKDECKMTRFRSHSLPRKGDIPAQLACMERENSSPRNKLQLISENDICNKKDAREKKKNKFSSTVRRFLRFSGAHKEYDRGEVEKKSYNVSNKLDFLTKSRPIIIHPLDLHRNGVEIIPKKTQECSSPNQITSSEDDQSGTSDSPQEVDSVSVRSESSVSSTGVPLRRPRCHPRRKSSGDSSGNLSSQQEYITALDSPVENGCTDFMGQENSKPVPAPRTLCVEIGSTRPPLPPERNVVKPARPPPPKPEELMKVKRAAAQAKLQESLSAGEAKEPTVYANLGEIRSGIAPSKPQRSGSLRDEMESMGKRTAPQPPLPLNGEITTLNGDDCNYEWIQMPVDSDWVNSNKEISEVECTLENHLTTSEHNIYAIPIVTEIQDKDSEMSSLLQPIRKFSRLSACQGCAIVHKNFEDNYGAVVTANHEALTQIFDLVLQNRPIPRSLRPLKTLPNLQFINFTLLESEPPFTIGHRTFINAEWGNHPISLVLSHELNFARSTPAPNLFSVHPIASFVDFVPKKYFPAQGNVRDSDNESIRAAIMVLPRMQFETITTFALKRLSISIDKEYEQDVSFILLQLINALKYVQSRGIEDVRASLDSIVLSHQENDPNYRLILLDDEAQAIYAQPHILVNGPTVPEKKLSLCQCALMVLREFFHLKDSHCQSSTVFPVTFEKCAAILNEEKAVSLSHVKAMLEYILWGPGLENQSTLESIGSTEEEQAIQRWLDLERASVLNVLIRSQGMNSIELSALEEYHLLFLLRTSAKILQEAADRLNGVEEISYSI